MDPFLEEAMREVDAMIPTCPIAPPRPPARLRMVLLGCGGDQRVTNDCPIPDDLNLYVGPFEAIAETALVDRAAILDGETTLAIMRFPDSYVLNLTPGIHGQIYIDHDARLMIEAYRRAKQAGALAPGSLT